MNRSENLQAFLDAAFAGFDRFAANPDSRRSIAQIAAALKTVEKERTTPGKRLAVCDDYLVQTMDTKSEHAALGSLIACFRQLEPRLEWKTRTIYDDTASANFPGGHANAMIIGPGALEHRQDVWLGVSLLAPHVRYPDHHHAPEETYLVLSEGEFRQADDDWFAPGVGGSFYNPPNIRHAMRSGDKPLFALWALLPDHPQS